MEVGWSTKKQIRRLVLSRTYRLSSSHDAVNVEADPDNVLLWRMSKRRLEAEALRDSLLEVAGRLDKTPPASSPAAVNGDGNNFALMRGLSKLDSGDRQRAVYLPVIRDSVVESLAIFDFPDATLVSGQRSTTNVPAQGLYLLNGPFVLGHSEAAAERLLSEGSDDAHRLKLAYLRFLGRPPTDTERKASEQFLARYPEILAADGVPAAKRPLAVWTALCQALVVSADFLFVR